MKEAIGSIPIYNFIIIFILITFGFLSATLSYMKAFKVNSRIAIAIEKHEGYNVLAKQEINNALWNLGYLAGTAENCPNKKGATKLATSDYQYCIYRYPAGEKTDRNGYFYYGIISYIYVDLPIVGRFTIPVYHESERIYKFSS